MKLLDAGEVLPDNMVLDLVSTKLASEECQKNGWVLEGIGTAGGVEELEEAIVMATEVRRFFPYCVAFALTLLSLQEQLTFIVLVIW